MKIEIKKDNRVVLPGDILSIISGNDTYTFLLFHDSLNMKIGAINLADGDKVFDCSDCSLSDEVVKWCASEYDAHTYKIFKNSEVTLILE